MIQIFGTSKCKATRAAERFFADRGLRVQRIDLASKGMARGEIARVAKAVGGVGALVDKASARAKDRGLHVLAIDDARLTAMLVDDPLLLRTPVVARGPQAAVGSDEAAWRAMAEAEKAGGGARPGP